MNDCDYYILILAGRYGSLDSDGVGFTEKEYDYAISKGIPVMSFVVEDIGKLPNSKCDNTDQFRSKLEAFRKKVCERKLVRFFQDTNSLKAAVAISLNQCVHDYPAKGWVRGHSITDEKDAFFAIKEYAERIIAASDAIPIYNGEFIIEGN